MKVKVNWDLSGDSSDDVITLEEAGIPEVVEVPHKILEDDVSDWLSDTYGYCHFGWCEL